MPEVTGITEDWLNELCDFTGLEAYLPLGIIGLPAGFGIMPGPGVKFSLTKDLPNGLIEVDEQIVDYAKQFAPKNEIWVKDANGRLHTRDEYQQIFEKDPVLVLGWMRRHPGVWTPQGQVTTSGGGMGGKPPAGSVIIGGSSGIHTPYQRPGGKGKKKPIKLGSA